MRLFDVLLPVHPAGRHGAVHHHARVARPSDEARAALFGAAAGALTLALLGFTWGGWSTRGKAEDAAAARAQAAVVSAVAPLCVERFRRDPQVAVNSARLAQAHPWSRATLIDHGGWAALPGPQDAVRAAALARACADLLVPS